jgi:hypothetical protein
MPAALHVLPGAPRSLAIRSSRVSSVFAGGVAARYLPSAAIARACPASFSHLSGQQVVPPSQIEKDRAVGGGGLVESRRPLEFGVQPAVGLQRPGARTRTTCGECPDRYQGDSNEAPRDEHDEDHRIAVRSPPDSRRPRLAARFRRLWFRSGWERPGRAGTCLAVLLLSGADGSGRGAPVRRR